MARRSLLHGRLLHGRSAGARRLAAGLGLRSLLALVASGCAAVAGLDEDVRLGGSTTAVSSSAGGGQGEGGGGAPSTTGGGEDGTGGAAIDCTAMDVPGYPGSADPGGDLEVVLAVRTLVLNDDDGPVVGLNLDATCTCPGQSSCIPDEGTDEDLLCDAAGGVDVQSSRIFSQLGLLTNDQFSSRELTQEAEAGGWSLLLRIEGWTGQPTDSKVRVSLFPSQGFETPPLWDGLDAWPVDATSVVEGGTVDDPVFADGNAYVADGTLVASLPQSGVVFASGDTILRLDLVGGFLKGSLREENGLWVLRDAVLAARLPTAGLFASLDDFRDGNGDPLCTNSPLFGIAHDTICEAADIFSGTATPTSPCDSISVGLGFTADQALLGAVREPPPGTPGCEPGTEASSCDCTVEGC